MKKVFFITIFIFVFGFALLLNFSFAQGMPALSGVEGMGFQNSSSNSATIQSRQREEQEGKQFLDNLNNKTVTCAQLKDADFEKIGEYFMGQSIGNTSRHMAMNEMMKIMMGGPSEEEMHSAMGKRLSGCDSSTAFPSQRGGGNSMMNFGFTPFGSFGWIFMFVFWGFLIWAIIALIRGSFGKIHMCGHDHGDGRHGKDKSPLEILKERYAKGEIDKKEFEEKKKDLS